MPAFCSDSKLALCHKNERKYYFSKVLLYRTSFSRGAYSEVWLAKDLCTNVYVPLKIYVDAYLDNEVWERVMNQLSIWVNIHHKNLISPYFYDISEGKPWAVFPYFKNGDLIKAIGQFTEEQAWMLIRDVSNALAFLHSLYLLTDWCSINIQNQIKMSLQKESWSTSGSCDYLAPERFGRNDTPTIENDIYALGITVYELLTGNTPFGGYGALCQKNGASIPDIEGNYSELLKNTIKQCLALEPWDRPSAKQLVRISEAALQDEKNIFKDYLYRLREMFRIHK